MTAIPAITGSFSPTLPGHYYAAAEIYQLEQERIFGAMWVCVGRADSVAQPGQYFLATLAGESVIVVRGRDEQLRAFLNVCRHRGARLCVEPTGQLRSSLQCGYHAWTYGLDGRLIGAPNVLHDEVFDRAAYGLVPVALETWNNLVWLNLSQQPESLAAQLAEPLDERFGDTGAFERYNLGGLRVGHSIRYDVPANWKLCVENFMECYHCGPVHPELCRLIPAFRSGISYQLRPGEGSPLADDVEAFSASGKGDRPMLPGLLPEDDRLYYGFVLWPNVFVNLLPDHVILHTALPQGPDRTVVVCDWLFAPEVVEQPDFDPSDTVAAFDLVNRQDWEMCELTQQGMGSRAYARGGVYVPTEQHLAGFNSFVRQRLNMER